MMVRGMGVVLMGAGGNAADYTFDPASGLSNDPKLAYYLQDLTPAQLQTALTNPSGVTADLTSLLNQAMTGTGAGALPCGSANSNDPNCTGGVKSSMPSWLPLALGGVGVLLIVFGTRR